MHIVYRERLWRAGVATRVVDASCAGVGAEDLPGWTFLKR